MGTMRGCPSTIEVGQLSRARHRRAGPMPSTSGDRRSGRSGASRRKSLADVARQVVDDFATACDGLVAVTVRVRRAGLKGLHTAVKKRCFGRLDSCPLTSSLDRKALAIGSHAAGG